MNKTLKRIFTTALMVGGLISTAGSNSVKRPTLEEQFKQDFNSSLDSLAEYAIRLKHKDDNGTKNVQQNNTNSHNPSF